MSERLEARAEVLKLARLLEKSEGELAFLERLPAAELRAFREAATERLFSSGAKRLERLGAAAKLLPSGLIATIAQRAFGPLLCARAAGSVDTEKAIDVARRLPPDFLADVTVALDPRRVAAIIADVPEELVVPVAEELGRRREHVTMGRFLAYVPDRAITAAMGALSDEVMLRTAFVLEHKERLDHAVGLLPPERLPGIVRLASELGLWPEALDLLESLSEERRVRLAQAAAFHDPDVLRGIINAAADQGLWVDLVPLIEVLPREVRPQVAEIAAALEPERLERVLRDAANAPQTLGTLLELVSELSESERAPVIAAIDRADRTVAEHLVAAVSDPLEMGKLLALATPDMMAAIERGAERLGMQETLRMAIDAAATA